MYAHDQRPRHPFTDAMRKSMCFDDPFDEPMVRRAIAAYFGLTTFMDHNVGKILKALESIGMLDNTRVVYSSDHGDNLGARGMWGKSTMYEESAGIPMIAAGPDIPRGKICDTPVTLADAFPTYIQSVGAKLDAADATLPGASLIDIANGLAPRRTILSEYHAAASITGTSMIRCGENGKYKYVHYVGLPPMLFDLQADPHERADLGRDRKYAGVIAECEAVLRTVVDPDAANRNAKSDQSAAIEKNGGKDAILGKGTFRYSPPPGIKAAYH
jgi:choline-sulfatase